MDQVEIDGMLQGAKEYDAEKYLAEAAKLLSRNKKLNVEIDDCEWYVSDITNKLVLKIWYLVDGHDVLLKIVESIFKDYQRPADAEIGIKPGMEMKHKIILRLAYVLYKHRED